MNQWTAAAVILMAVFFLLLPALLAVLEYRMTRKSKKQGIHFLVGVLVLSAFMPAYAVYLGTILLITWKVSLRRAADKQA